MYCILALNLLQRLIMDDIWPCLVLSLTQENALKLHSVGRHPYHSRRRSGVKTYRSCRKHESLSQHDVVFPFITGIKSNLCTALISQNNAENSCIISHAQNTTVLHCNVLLMGIHRLPITNKGRSPFPSANHSQGQPQTPQSLSVVVFSYCSLY
jgi:hypothetical protein